MKKFKKILAVMLSLAMILGMSLTAFAEGETTKIPNSDDTAEVTVSNVATGAKVNAFKIAEGNWNDYGFTGYSKIEFTKGDGTKVSMSDIYTPSAESILALSNVVDKTKGSALEEKQDGTYRAELTVGVYMVLVTENGDNDKTIYNPMIVSVYYNTDGNGTTMAGSVDAGNEYTIEGSDAYAKKDVPTIDKKIVGSGSGYDKGDDTAINDVIKFEIKSSIPKYTSAYTSADYAIIDTLSKGLSVDAKSVEITVGGEAATVDTDYKVKVDIAADGKTTMRIDFTNTETNRYVLSKQGKEIVVHYNATLNENATINYEANTNTVKAEYTNNPNTDEKAETDEKKTYHYTFGIDAELNGSASNPTGELFKTDENDDGTLVEGAPVITPKHPLNGAKFKLTRTHDNKGTPVNNGKSYEAISGNPDDKGVYQRPGALTFTGLDDGTYELVEIEPPKGYSLNDKKHTVTIKADYNADGTLKEYSVIVDGKTTDEKESVYEGKYTTDTNGQMVVTADHRKEESALIKNTKLAELPSTGGIGTTIFTIGGCIIMIVAAGLFFASRRKSAK